MISHIKDALVQIESTHKEDQAMLAEFWEFDRKMIDEKYESVV